jgi:uncharacterized SAM-binding protein YcdF (DUF218 family)
LLPLPQVVLLLVCAMLALGRGRSRLAGVLLALAVGWLLLFSSSWMAQHLMARLERDYPPQAANTLPNAPALVLLGGATRGATSLVQTADLNAYADRLLFAARLYQLGKAPLVVVSGGSPGRGGVEAREMADILAIMGVPPAAMLLEGHSRNTYENAVYSSQLLQQRGIQRVLLVTSAFHMRRARAVFEARGIAVIPAATDYQRLLDGEALPPWLPSASALQRSTVAVWELAGMLVYRQRGYF